MVKDDLQKAPALNLCEAIFFFTFLHKFWVPTPYVCLVPPIHACKNNSDENQAQNFRQTITSDR